MPSACSFGGILFRRRLGDVFMKQAHQLIPFVFLMSAGIVH
jgi:hypothetical protein